MSILQIVQNLTTEVAQIAWGLFLLAWGIGWALRGYTLASMSSVTLVVLLINRGLLRTLSTVNPRYMDYAAAATLLLTALYIYLNPNC